MNVASIDALVTTTDRLGSAWLAAGCALTGPRCATPDWVRERIAHARADGHTFDRIARDLNHHGITRSRGGLWNASGISVEARRHARRVATDQLRHLLSADPALARAYCAAHRARVGTWRQRAAERQREIGNRCGKECKLPVEIQERLVRERAEGLGPAQISQGLNRDGVPTVLQHGKWYHASVTSALRTIAKDRAADELREALTNASS